MARAFDVRSQNWKVRGISQLDVGRGIAGGISGFHFANLDQPCIHTFIFVGIGLGLSARRKAQKAGAEAAKGSNGLPVTLDDGDWDDLECLQYFSGDDLDWSLGQIASAGAALVVGYQYLLITGGTSVFHEPYFRNEPCPGYMLGLGAGANWLTGFWIRCGRVMRYRAHMKPKIVLALPPLDPCRRVRAVVLPRGQLGSLLGTEVPRLASGPEPVTGDARCPLVKLLEDPHGGGSPDGIGKAQG